MSNGPARSEMFLYNHATGSVDAPSDTVLEQFPRSSYTGQSAYDPVSRTYYTVGDDDVLRGYDFRRGRVASGETHRLKHRLTSLEVNVRSVSAHPDGE